jgi:hypothetical protein
MTRFTVSVLCWAALESAIRTLRYTTLPETIVCLLGQPQTNAHSYDLYQSKYLCRRYLPGLPIRSSLVCWPLPWNASLPCPFQHLCKGWAQSHHSTILPLSFLWVLSVSCPDGVQLLSLWHSLLPSKSSRVEIESYPAWHPPGRVLALGCKQAERRGREGRKASQVCAVVFFFFSCIFLLSLKALSMWHF